MVRKLLSRHPAEWLRYAGAACLVGTVRLSLVLFSFRTVTRVLRRGAVVLRGSRPADDAYRDHVVQYVGGVARYMLPNRPCLPQALVVQFLLQRKGYPTTLHIGVAKDPGGGLMAHAWVEDAGRVLIGGEYAPYSYRELHGVEATL